MDEDLRLKAHEISTLKEGLATLQRSKEEALEAQRRDLTGTFQQIIRNREEGFKEKESEIGRQVGLLSEKLEKLQNELTRCRDDNRECKLINEKLLADIGGKDHSIRELSYDLDDMKRSKELLEDGLQRQVTSLQIEIKRIAEMHSREKADLCMQIENANSEAEREREFRAVVEGRLGEAQESAASEAQALRDQLILESRKHGILAQENELLRSEKVQQLQRLGKARVDVDSLMESKEQLERELQSQLNHIQRLEHQLSDISEQYESLQQEHIAFRVAAEKRADQLTEDNREKIMSEQRKLSDAILRLESQHREEVNELSMRSSQEQTRLAQVEAELRAAAEKAVTLSNALQSAQRELSEQKLETEALRLRLRSQEQQLIAAKDEVRELRSAPPTLELDGPYSPSLSIEELPSMYSLLKSPGAAQYRPPLQISTTPRARGPPRPPTADEALQAENEDLRKQVRKVLWSRWSPAYLHSLFGCHVDEARCRRANRATCFAQACAWPFARRIGIGEEIGTSKTRDLSIES